MALAITIASLDIADDPQLWREAGFAVEPDGTCQVGQVSLHLASNEQGSGIVSWSVVTDACPPSRVSLNGLDTSVAAPPTDVIPPTLTPHANGVASIDHLVVYSPDIDAMVIALQDIGLEPRRTRQHVGFGQQMRQVFFRMGEVILEVVGPEPEDGNSKEGIANFFGLTFTVSDLDATASYLGEHLGRIKEAVQPGRSIATLRSSAGLNTPVAFMTPEPRSRGKS